MDQLLNKGFQIDNYSKQSIELSTQLENIKKSKKIISLPKIRFPYSNLLGVSTPFPPISIK